MTNKSILFILILALAASSLSCGLSVDLGTKSKTATVVIPTTAQNSTIAPATTPSPVIPTAEEKNLEEEQVPTIAPSPTPLPPPQVISSSNAAALTYKRIQGPGTLQKMKVSPDGKSVLLAYSSLLVMINISDLKVIWQIDPGKLFWDVAFSKDGSHLVSASPGGTVQMWDAASGSLLSTTLAQSKGVRDIALSDFGEYFAVLDYKDTTTVWDTATGKQVQDNNGQANPGGINHIDLSPGGGVLLIDGIDSKLNKQLQQWKITDGTYKIGLLGLMKEMSSWEFSPDASRIFGINYRSLTANRSTILTAWNANNGALIKTFEDVGLISRYLVSPDGASILAATEDNVIHLLNVESGKATGSFNGHSSEIAAMDFSPDSQGVISIDVSGKIILWDVVNQKQVNSADGQFVSPYSPVVFSGFGRLAALLSPDMKSIGIIDTKSRQPIQKIGPEPRLLDHLAISIAGTYVAACDEDNRISIWEIASGKKVQMIQAKTRFPIWKMKFSPNEKLISSLSDGQIFVWDALTGLKKQELAGSFDFDYSPAEKIIASDSIDFNLYFTDVDTGKKLSLTKAEFISALAFSPDGRYVAIGGKKNQPVERGLNNLIYLIDSKSKERLPIEMQEIPGLITDIAFNPNQDLLASKDEQGNVQIWDLRDGKLIGLFEEISMSPGGLVFNEDGSILYVGGSDGVIGMVSTSGSATANVPAASEAGETTVPELSDQPYNHTSGAMTVNLPKGWKVVENSNLVISATSPSGVENVSVLATNTIKPLSDGGFIDFVNGYDQAFVESLSKYEFKETNREIEAEKGYASLTKEFTSEGNTFIIFWYFTRVDAVVYQMIFFTRQEMMPSYISVFQGVNVSLKVNKDYVMKQIPYADLSVVQDPAGKFEYSYPKGWLKGETRQATDPNVSFAAPDGSAALHRDVIQITSSGNPTDEQLFILMQTALQKQDPEIRILRKDKTDSGNWQITYTNPTSNNNGVMVALRIENSLQSIDINYDATAESQYKPLIAKLIVGLKAK